MQPFGQTHVNIIDWQYHKYSEERDEERDEERELYATAEYE
jgi:hypothetical protein